MGCIYARIFACTSLGRASDRLGASVSFVEPRRFNAPRLPRIVPGRFNNAVRFAIDPVPVFSNIRSAIGREPDITPRETDRSRNLKFCPQLRFTSCKEYFDATGSLVLSRVRGLTPKIFCSSSKRTKGRLTRLVYFSG